MIATVRTPSQPIEVVRSRYPNQLRIETVDIADAADVACLRQRIATLQISVLFVVAGVNPVKHQTVIEVGEQDFIDLLKVNTLAPLRIIETLEPLVGQGGVIAAMSSQLASITRTTGSNPLYSASKAALNMLFSAFAARRPGDSRAMLLITPGWVRTTMGGAGAQLTIEESVRPTVDTLQAHLGRPGLRFVDRFGAPLPW